MKKILIKIAAITTATLFAACSKESSPYTIAKDDIVMEKTETPADKDANTLVGNTANTSSYPSPDMVGPHGTAALYLVTSPSLNSPVSWTVGGITVGSVVFDGYQKYGHAFHWEHFETKIEQSYRLFNLANLADVNLNTGLYYGIDFTIALNPAVNQPVLMLNGNVNGTNTQVQVMINESIQLKAAWSGNIRVEDGKRYSGRLMLDMAQVTGGITPAMLANAERTNGTIFISMNSNRNLYQLILANLQRTMQVQFG